MTEPDPKTVFDPQTAARLAEATFDLWQEQWQLLAGDAEAQQNIQAMMELMGRTAAFWNDQVHTATQAAQGGTDAATPTPADDGTARHHPAAAAPWATSFAAAPDTGGATLAELADAVTYLAAKVTALEKRLAHQVEDAGDSSGNMYREA